MLNYVSVLSVPWVSLMLTLRIGPGIRFRFKILCSLWYTETFALWIELASGSDVTGSARWCIRFTVRHG